MAKKNKKDNKGSTAPPTRAGSAAPDVASSAVLDSGVATPIPPASTSKLPPYVGINFGNSYASIAVFAKEGQPECIANEDGERQIACALSFNGEEAYIGNQAKAQLVKNAKNTIVGFRNLLGKKFSEISSSSLPSPCAPIVAHPELDDTPAYKVNIADPSDPSNTIERLYTPKQVAGIFLKSLIGSAEAFLGVKVEGAVISIPEWFSPEARAQLEQAAKEEAGVPYVLQLLEEAAAVVAVTTLPSWTDNADLIKEDRTQLVVDLGSSSLSLSLLSIRQGLAYVLASSHTSEVGSNKIDDKLVTFFASDFTKKTKIPLKVCPAPADSVQDQRAEAKLRLAIEYTKRTLSASPGAAACSVESLKDGVDYTGTINRMRFDMVVATVYADVASRISKLLANPVPYSSSPDAQAAPIDPHDIDEIVYVGGSTALPGLDERILLSVGLREDVVTPYSRNASSSAAAASLTPAEQSTSLASGGLTDPTTLVARGCASQASLISSLVHGSQTSEEDAQLLKAFREKGHYTNVRATTRTIGVLFPGIVEDGEEDEISKSVGGLFVPVVPKETALPVRRIVEIDVEAPSTSGEVKVVSELWEVEEGIRIEKIDPPPREPLSDEEDEEEDEEEPEEVKHRTLTKRTFFGLLSISVPSSSASISRYTPPSASSAKGKVKVVDPVAEGAKNEKKAGKKYVKVRVVVIVGVDGKLDAELAEGGVEEGGVKDALSVAAP